MNMRPATVQDIVDARSIAIIGASSREDRWGFTMTKRLLDTGYAGQIYPVNPKGGSILGLEVYRSVEEIPGEVDVGLVALGNEHVLETAGQCAAKGVKGIVVYSGGFAEVDDSQSSALQERLLATARSSGMRIVGPNCNGIYNAKSGLNLTGNAAPRAGRIALISQSGNIGLWWFGEARRRDVGLAFYFALGNAADIGIDEYISFLDQQEDVRVIVLVHEGLPRARTFMEVANRTSRRKPIVTLKLGRTSAGVSAARTHTASIAGSTEVFRGAFRQAGIIQARSFDELIDLAEALSGLPSLAGTRVALLGGGGGHATNASDLVTEAGLQLANLQGRTRAVLRDILPWWANVANPVEFAGGADYDPGVFDRSLAACLADAGVDGGLIFGLFGGYRVDQLSYLHELYERAAKAIVNIVHDARKPVVVHTVYANEALECLNILRRGGIPVVASLDVAARCLGALAEWSIISSRGIPSASALTSIPDRGRVGVGLLRRLPEDQSAELLHAKGIRCLPLRRATDRKRAAEIAREIGMPVVLRIASEDVVHKRRAGGVALGLCDEQGISIAFEELVSGVSEIHPDARISGVWVSPMIFGALELALGAVYDSVFGPVVMCGLGGPVIEQLGHKAFRLIPLAPREAQEMVNDAGLTAMLEEILGQDAEHFVVQLSDTIVALGNTLLEQPEIEEIDLNPVFATRDGPVVGDARILIAGI